ncbi:MAG: MFS transporter [Bacteroidota bacterium]
MSTIAIVQKNQEICIASESLTTFGTLKLNEDFSANPDKIFPWGDSYVGMVGMVSIHMVLRDIAEKETESPDFSSVSSIYQYFTKLHADLKEKYFLNPKEDDDDPVESSQFLIAIVNKHGMFGVHSLREVHPYKKFWAYGSGKRYALGAMHAVFDREEFDAEAIARAGIQAGITFDDGSGGTIRSFKVKMDKPL